MLLPTVSIVIPTLNAAKLLRQCLASVSEQRYPKKNLEVIISDAGSTDETLEIAKQFGAEVYNNPLKTAESGKALGIRKASNELVLLIDADNLLYQSDWLQKMVAPFADKQIVASEPLFFSHRRKDPLITRYCALIGMNDPVCLFLGNYDRFNYVTNRWTEVPIKSEQKSGYIKFRATGDRFMTMGANGFMGRRKELLPYAKSDYYFDVDVTKRLALDRHAWFAKVDVGIVHIFATSIAHFIKKQRRRVKDFLFFRSRRDYSVGVTPRERDVNPLGLAKFAFSVILLVPIIVQTVIGFVRKPDIAWAFHLPACVVTLVIYSFNVILYTFTTNRPMMTRENW